jgi:hypothetical protein
MHYPTYLVGLTINKFERIGKIGYIPPGTTESGLVKFSTMHKSFLVSELKLNK